MKKLILVSFVVLTSSCASSVGLKDFEYEEAQKDQAVKDSAFCRMEGNKFTVNQGRYNAIYESCMVSKGYKRK